MSFLFPRVSYHHPASRCGPVAVSRQEVAPIFSLFDDAFNDLYHASRQAQRQSKPWNPKFDVKEDKDFYTIEAEVPGVEQKDLNIEFTDEHTIQIKGRHERRSESGTRPQVQAVEGEEKSTSAIEEGTSTIITPASEETAETSSNKSYQATVSDEEQPANSSAVTETEEPKAAPTPAPEQQQQQQQPKTPKSQYWVSERTSGSFTRSFAFPVPVSQEAVKASLKNGVLSIYVPKAPKPESRRIQIE